MKHIITLMYVGLATATYEHMYLELGRRSNNGWRSSIVRRSDMGMTGLLEPRGYRPSWPGSSKSSTPASSPGGSPPGSPGRTASGSSGGSPPGSSPGSRDHSPARSPPGSPGRTPFHSHRTSSAETAGGSPNSSPGGSVAGSPASSRYPSTDRATERGASLAGSRDLMRSGSLRSISSGTSGTSGTSASRETGSPGRNAPGPSRPIQSINAPPYRRRTGTSGSEDSSGTSDDEGAPSPTNRRKLYAKGPGTIAATGDGSHRDVTIERNNSGRIEDTFSNWSQNKVTSDGKASAEVKAQHVLGIVNPKPGQTGNLRVEKAGFRPKDYPVVGTEGGYGIYKSAHSSRPGGAKVIGTVDNGGDVQAIGLPYRVSE